MADPCFSCGQNPADCDGLCVECVAMAYAMLGEPIDPEIASLRPGEPPRPITTVHLPGDET